MVIYKQQRNIEELLHYTTYVMFSDFLRRRKCFFYFSRTLLHTARLEMPTALSRESEKNHNE